MQAVCFAVISYGYVAAAVCVLIGPVFIPWFIVPTMDWLFWGWFKAFIDFSFYQVIASAFIFVFSKVLTSMFSKTLYAALERPHSQDRLIKPAYQGDVSRSHQVAPHGAGLRPRPPEREHAWLSSLFPIRVRTISHTFNNTNVRLLTFGVITPSSL